MNSEQTKSVPLVEVRDLSIRFGDVEAPATVDAVDFDISKGEIVALVGESGSGKTLLAHTLAGILTPTARLTARRLRFAGADLLDGAEAWRDLCGREIGIVFQNPRAALNPVRPVGRQIADVIRHHRLLRGAQLAEAVIEALHAVRIPDPRQRTMAYAAELSGGMCQRVMLAIALAGGPALLIADEPTTGLDTTTQAAILDLILEQAAARHMATLLITHDLGLARSYAQRMIVLHAGQIVEAGPTDALFARPRHPYSARLIAATPALAGSVADLAGIGGAPPDLALPLPACRFALRCERADDACRTLRPSPVAVAAERGAACWHPL